MSSTTIRYSGVPENHHSRRFETESTSGLDTDAAAYTNTTGPAGHLPGVLVGGQADDLSVRLGSALAATPDPNRDSALTLKWRKRLRELTDWRSDQATGRAYRSAQTDAIADQSGPPEPSGFVPGFTPGKAGPVGSDPRHHRAYPHPQNPGLFHEPDGFYDWANRRLFLTDGSPDPATPGAYRYQTRPDLCDLDASDADPASPRYEPMHLRHQPGDDWIIDRDRPYDVLDSGPFGSPGWFPDRRTGRHRRAELPDPIPWWEIEEAPDKAEWAEAAEKLWERRTRTTHEREDREAAEAHQREACDRGPGAADGTRWSRGAAEDRPCGAGDPAPKRPSRNDRPSPRPPSDTGELASPGGPSGPSGSGGSGATGPRTWPDPGRLPRQSDRRSTGPLPGRPGRPGEPGGPGEPGESYRFDKLREDAWHRFLETSAPLAAAHRTGQTAIEREGGPTIGRIARGLRLLAGLIRTKPRATEPAPVPPDRHRELASRTARFAQAVRGAERARTEHLIGVAAWA